METRGVREGGYEAKAAGLVVMVVLAVIAVIAVVVLVLLKTSPLS